jgi:LPXTG-motif cell wall-anchored protein
LLKRGISYALAVILTAGTFFGFGWSAPESAHAATGDIVAANSISVRDIVYYGNYPQTKAAPTPDGAPESPSTGNIYTDANSIKYEYVDASTNAYDGWYKYEPIAWRVLENAAGKLFLLSEKAIDAKAYNRDNQSVTWETCTARSWLNGYAKSENTDAIGFNDAGTNFIGNAFSATEQGFIPTTYVDNPDNVTFDKSGGNNTTDKIFYLKIDDVNNVSYGFTDNNFRKAGATDYVVAMGAYVSSGNVNWWLRSPGSSTNYAALVSDIGSSSNGGNPVYATTYATARPAFYLNTPGVIFRETGTPNEYQASIPSTDATLSSLAVSTGTLSPVFASATTGYSVSVPNAVNSITLTATKADANATVTGDGTKLLSVGTNTFMVTVTAEDEIAEKTYTVTVTRAAASTDANLINLSVSPGTLSPAFSPGTTSYTVSVPNATDSITLTAETTDTNATITGDGVKSLNVGENKFEITVTAQDGITKKIYTVTVTRAAPDKIADEDEDEDDSDDEDDEDDSDAVGEGENNDSDSGIASQPKTGDDISALWLISLLASAALISLLMVLFIRRKARME